ncbi:hypothetical protein ACFL2R_00565, partial [Patescibacteria group bacterium]
LSEFAKDSFKINHLVAIVVFGVIIFYGLFFDEVEKTEWNKKASYQSGVALESPNLTNDNPELVFGDILNSEEDDLYRLSFRAKADSDEMIGLKLKGKMGDEVEVESFSVKGPDSIKDVPESEYYEVIFSTNSNFNEVIFYKENIKDKKDIMKWDEGNVYVYDVRIVRLDLEKREAVDQILPTMIGENNISTNELLEAGHELDFSRRLSKKNGKVRQIFTAEWNSLLGVEINLDKVGKGGVGKYALKISHLDEDNRKVKMLKEFSFSTKSLKKYRQKNGMYYFDLNVPVLRGQSYYFEISNDNVKVDSDNYLAVNKISGSKNAYFSVDVMRFLETEDGDIVLRGARIEDFGSRLEYSYVSQRNIEEILNAYDFKGKLFFDAEDRLMANKLKTGNYFTYKINTIYPFSKMIVSAEQKKSQQDRNVQFEYSFDNKNWKKIKGDRDGKKSPIRYNAVIAPNNEISRVVYFRNIYTGSKKKKTRSFGLTDFEVNALLIRPEN